MEILPLRLHPELAAQAAEWFHQKWGVPAEDYRQSIDACLQGRDAVPQWYLARENGQIAGGVGVIENDFHDRKDLSPQCLRPVCGGAFPRAGPGRPSAADGLRRDGRPWGRYPLSRHRPYILL